MVDKIDLTNKKCEKCGSEFELTRHHSSDVHLNHREKESKNILPDKILCITCHYEVDEDFRKMLHCYSKAMEKRYYNKDHRNCLLWSFIKKYKLMDSQ